MNTTAKRNRRILIIGGVAGGASCAARLRRLDESAVITLIDRGPHMSFANCGLPYFVGGIIESEERLLISSPEILAGRFNIRARTRTEAVSIDRLAREVRIRDLDSGAETIEGYDALVLSPGATPIRPALEGIDLPGIFTVRSIPDSEAIREWIENSRARKAVVVGGGFIGLEMAENLAHRGLEVTIVEKLTQVMPPLDPEVAAVIARHLRSHGVHLALGDGVARFQNVGGCLNVETENGAVHPADIVILAIGVRPETTLARAAGLEIGARGGIRVDSQMQTSDPHIWAVGDAVEVDDFVLRDGTIVPLAGPANREGRIAADAICGRKTTFRGVQGTAICGLFGLQAASTGASEKALMRKGVTDFEKIYIHPNQHAGYYPGAHQMHLKLVFQKETGRILGAQAVGLDGVDRRIDVIAMCIQMGGTVFDLEDAELCYAPQFGGAKDAVNFAGMVAADIIRGDLPTVHWSEPSAANTLFLDVREPAEVALGTRGGSLNIPLPQLRSRLHEIPRQADVRAFCAVGIRGYLATRILLQHDYLARNLSGGWLSCPDNPDIS